MHPGKHVIATCYSLICPKPEWQELEQRIIAVPWLGDYIPNVREWELRDPKTGFTLAKIDPNTFKNCYRIDG